MTEDVEDHSTFKMIGRIVLFVVGLLIFVPMLIGVWNGIQTGHVKDPFTGRQVAMGAMGQMNCTEEARKLLDTPDNARPTDHWEGRYTDWVTHCRDNHPELFRMLETTRTELLGKEG